MDIYMGLLVFVLTIIILYNSKVNKSDKIRLVDKQQALSIRAICCLVVIFVHIPKEHSNLIQELIGSFGYIAVTLFFMLSSYGLKYSVENKKDYLKNFWKNRIVVLLIPFWIANGMSILLNPRKGLINNIFYIIGINNVSFITILIGYYVIFYMIYKFVKNTKIRDYILCSIVLAYSLIGRIMNLGTGWQVETMGFIYGIIIFYMNNMNKIIIKKKNILMILIILGSIIIEVLYIKYREIYILGTWLLRTMLGITLIALLTFILNEIKIGNKILNYIGNISYEIYLVHTIVIKSIEEEQLASGEWITIALILTILMATVLKFFDSKIIKMIKNT